MNDFVSGNLVIPALFGFYGQNIRSDIARLERSQWWSPDQLEAHQLGRARQIIDHAHQNFEFYRDLWGRDFSSGDIKDWSDFGKLPVITKNDVRNLEMESRTSGRLSRRSIIRKSSGTTGEPAIVRADYHAWAMSLAARFRCLNWHGVKRGQREGRFWGGSAKPSSSEKLRDLLINRLVIRPADLTEDHIGSLPDRLHRFRPSYLYGYFSLLNRLAEWLADTRQKWEPGGLLLAVVTAEMSTEQERAALARGLGLRVVNEYGCSEVDIIAFECEQGNMHLQSENVLLQVNPGSGLSDREGQAVVTDLNNLAMPLVRYTLGDWVALGGNSCACGRGLPLLSRVEGRSRDRFIQTVDGSGIHITEVVAGIRRICDRSRGFRRFFIDQESISRVHVRLDWMDPLAPPAALARRELEKFLEGTTTSQMVFMVENGTYQEVDITGKRSYFSPLADN